MNQQEAVHFQSHSYSSQVNVIKKCMQQLGCNRRFIKTLDLVGNPLGSLAIYRQLTCEKVLVSKKGIFLCLK